VDPKAKPPTEKKGGKDHAAGKLEVQDGLVQLKEERNPHVYITGLPPVSLPSPAHHFIS
jgi:hypothetical protein